MRNCWLLDIPVPQHLAILGVNNDETYCLSSSIGLSSVMLASEKIGFLAAKLLEDLHKGDASPDTLIRVPPLNVISRISTDMQSIQDNLVRKALCYIQDNVHRSIRVNDLLDYLSVSRRTLERRFKEKLGHSPHFAINRARVEVAKKLLEATDMKMEDIAEHCGFSEARILYRNFRMVAGVSPAKYRKNFR
jgi:LacI family transcriptional regulator